MISSKDIEIILDRCRIEEVVEEFYKLERSGRRMKCCCPVHNERTPSFVVDPDRNTYHCFGCGIHGNAISFLRETQHMSFPDACRHLAKKYHVELDETWEPQTDEEKDKRQEKEAMLAANKEAMAFFASRLCTNGDKRSTFAFNYATKRWTAGYVKQEDIGFAPGKGELAAHMQAKGFNQDLLLKIGLLSKNDAGRVYDTFWDRIVIPIRDKYRNVIGFTARRMDDEPPKYLNSPESAIYVKGSSVFGIHNIQRQANKEEVIYLVEGGPDVLKLQSLGINNTVASLGTAWTDKQFNMLRKYNARLCFIPDADPKKGDEKFGAGITAVMRNGLSAIKEGFNVTVKEIPADEKGKKADPDSFITSKEVLNALQEEDFIPWYAAKLAEGKETSTQKAEAIKQVAEAMTWVEDRLRHKMYLSQIAKIYSVPVSILQNAVNEISNSGEKKKKSSGEKIIDQELYQKYGFYERHNRYMSLDKEGADKEWSNFIMIPLIHVRDPISSKRLYKIKNDCGYEAVVEMKTEDLVSLQRFKIRLENEGNFRWKAKEDQLNMLKGLLYEAVDPAQEIVQLGWQKEEFFAFGNGVYHNGKWVEADQYGILRLGETGNFYLPSASILYAKDKGLFQFERRFIHTEYSEITFRQYTDKLIQVFGDNAKIGICFYLATLFKDIVVNVTEKFPILNLFGKKGSGKSTFGEFLMTFFVARNKAVNLTQSTEAGLAAAVAQVSNALVHIDEYKNAIDISRREFLKMLYDGIGRSRMNMDRDKKKEMTAVDCGVILSGQEMPTIDIAIFSRMIFLTFDKDVFNVDEKRSFNELSELRDKGCTHLTLQMLRHRTKFEEEFKGCYSSALGDMINAVAGNEVEDRILRSWTILLAAFRTLEGVMDIAIDYREMLTICKAGVLRQNGECRSANEVAGFWRTVDYLHQNGDIFIDADYRIQYATEFKGKGMKEAVRFKGAKKVLYLCTKRVFMLYKMKGKLAGDNTLPVDSLRHYLEHCPEYLGIKPAVRFKNLSNEIEATQEVTSTSGITSRQSTSRVDWALCFDYEALSEAFEINLEVDASPDDEPDPINIDLSDKSLPY